MRQLILGPAKKSSTQIIEASWLMTVAMAAPCTPIPNTKMNRGSSTRFSAAPSRVVPIPIRGWPSALMKPFRPVASMVQGVPSR